jgi:hypothetical protein
MVRAGADYVKEEYSMNFIGIDRNRTYTREEICSRFGYDAGDSPDSRNRNRFFREHFLQRGLRALPVGKTYEVSGEVYFAWTLANSRMCDDGDTQVQAGKAKQK